MSLNVWEEKSQEYAVRSRDFHTWRNVAMDAVDRSPPDITLTHIQYSLENHTSE